MSQPSQPHQPHDWHDIFLSHSSEDNDIARLVRGYFQQHNIQIWIDVHDADTGGMTRDAWIEKIILPNIGRCSNFIVLISQNSLKSPWVKREIEVALALLDQRKIKRILGLIVDNTPISSLNPPFSEFKSISILEKHKGVDILRGIRDDIGKTNPTYIPENKPNFIKVVSLNHLSDHIALCDPDDIKIWYVNGGRSFSDHIIPGLRNVLRKSQDRTIECKVMLADSEHLRQPKRFPSFDLGKRYWFQDRLDNYINEAKFLYAETAHHRAVMNSFQRISALQSDFDNLQCTFRLSGHVPAGRVIIIGDIGFYGPHIAESNAELPLLVFDRRSPFFSNVEKHFNDAFGDARPLR